MNTPFLELATQFRALEPEIEQAVARVLASGWYILGRELAAFETQFAAYLHAGHAVGVGSGTDAIHLALRACGVQPGDDVITVPHTAAPTVCAIIQAQARPVFVDIDADTYTMVPERLEAYLAGRSPGKAKAIVPVHLYGNPADMDALGAIARAHGLCVVEDAAQAHGAAYHGRHVGRLGDAGCFSFYPTKNLGAYGDAGMVVTDDAGIADRLRMLRNYGERAKFCNVSYGVNSRLDELQAAVLAAKLPHLDEWNAIRRSHARLYADRLADTPLVLPQERPDTRHAFHLYVVRTPERDALEAHLKDRGVATAVHYPTPLHLQEAYRALGYAAGDFPVAEKVTQEILSLPLYPEMTEDAIEHVCSAIRDCF